MKRRIKSNDSAITFRLPKTLKDSFIEMCKSRNEHYQTVLREMIQESIKEPRRYEEQRRRSEYLKGQRLL